jgi:hypothetical protein
MQDSERPTFRSSMMIAERRVDVILCFVHEPHKNAD